MASSDERSPLNVSFGKACDRACNNMFFQCGYRYYARARALSHTLLIPHTASLRVTARRALHVTYWQTRRSRTSVARRAPALRFFIYLLYRFMVRQARAYLVFSLVTNVFILLSQLYQLIYLIIVRRLGRVTFSPKYKIATRTFIFILFISFLIKDLTPLRDILLHHMRQLNFWLYKKFFMYMRFLFLQMLWLFNAQRARAGFLLCWRGKINIAGNGRTRTLRARHGQTALNDASLSTSMVQLVVRTFTGAIGVTILIRFLGV